MKLKNCALLITILLSGLVNAQFRANWGGFLPTINYTGGITRKLDVNIFYFGGYRFLDLEGLKRIRDERFLTFLSEQGLTYRFNNRFSLGGYYAAQTYYPFSMLLTQIDRRFVLQGSYTSEFKYLSVVQRLRFEDQHVTSRSSAFNFTEKAHFSRFRYRIGIDLPIIDAVYFSAYEELFLSTTKRFSPYLLNENWMYYGVGKKLDTRNRLEFGMLRMSWRQHLNQWANLYNFQFTWVHTPKLRN